VGQFLIVPYYPFSFSCAGAYTLSGFPFKTYSLNLSVLRSMLWFHTSERV
jgi:hypothetical protein